MKGSATAHLAKGHSGYMHLEIMRRVKIPAAITGHLWLGPMPGYHHPLSNALVTFEKHNIDRIFCLTPASEVAEKSPHYAEGFRKAFPFPVTAVPVADFGVPTNETAYAQIVREAAQKLKSAQHLFIHCAEGIGRTGTFAVCVLIALGFEMSLALNLVLKAGSAPETNDQEQFIQRIARSLSEPSALHSQRLEITPKQHIH